MSRGPNGEWRPASTAVAAIMGCRILTGEIDEQYAAPGKKPSAETRAKMPPPEEIARKAEWRRARQASVPDRASGPKRHA